MKAQSLKLAGIKTLCKSELYDQREFNGVKALKSLLGAENKEFNAIFRLRGTEMSCRVATKWYEARESHATRSEFRLYYEKNSVMDNAHPGDNIVIGFDKNDVLNCILFLSGNDEHQGNIPEWSSI